MSIGQVCSDTEVYQPELLVENLLQEDKCFTALAAALWVPHWVCTEVTLPLGHRQPTMKHSRETHSGPLLGDKTLL